MKHKKLKSGKKRIKAEKADTLLPLLLVTVFKVKSIIVILVLGSILTMKFTGAPKVEKEWTLVI